MIKSWPNLLSDEKINSKYYVFKSLETKNLDDSLLKIEEIKKPSK
jgi:hypothetical protein